VEYDEKTFQGKVNQSSGHEVHIDVASVEMARSLCCTVSLGIVAIGLSAHRDAKIWV
jgi:hypothetical protein